MKLTAKVNVLENSTGALKAFADLIIDDVLVVKGFRILTNKNDNSTFVSPPTTNKEVEGESKWFDNVTYLDYEEKHSATREAVSEAILAAYKEIVSPTTRQNSAAANKEATKFTKKTNNW